MAGTPSDEPITSPDQHRSHNPKVVSALWILGSLALLSMTFGNHRGWIENAWLVGLAALGLTWVVVDWVLRRNGLR